MLWSGAVSTPRIQVLPAALADQIAAGEVVERPASVVKELVENALDAGAGRIEVEIAGGGQTLIRVVDDGAGMSAEEAHLALKRHATSKLHSLDELHDLRTMGFRGEALPSIAAVSRLTLTTRVPDEIEGYRLLVEGGDEKDARAAGCARGTSVEVRDLFWNVPARLKFLKAEATETAHVIDTVIRLALAHPEIHLRLRTDAGRMLIDLPPHRSILERATAALGRRGPVHLHLAEGGEGGVRVTACLASPAESSNTTRNTFLFVNRRFLRDRGLLHSVSMGYGELVERGRYPMAVVSLEVPPADVDVNVHPQKTEMRFARPQVVQAAVRHVLRSACAKAPWLDEPAGVRVYHLPPERTLAARDPGAGGDARLQEALSLFAPRPQGYITPQPALPFGPPPVTDSAEVDPLSIETEEAAATTRAVENERSPGGDSLGFFASLRYLGQIHRTYLVCEGSGELVLIDQHAAHERVAFERLKSAHAAHAVRTQRLLFPQLIELDDARAAAAKDCASVLGELGFELEDFGGRSFAVKAVPEPLAEAAIAEVVGDMLDELSARGSSDVLADRLDHLFATMACHSVVRAGDVLDERRVRALLDSMDGIDFRAHCPHGRPVLLRMSVGELERRFGRT